MRPPVSYREALDEQPNTLTALADMPVLFVLDIRNRTVVKNN